MRSKALKIATWNTKQGVAPRQKEPELWEWIQGTINPDVIVLTEAKVPKAGCDAEKIAEQIDNE